MIKNCHIELTKLIQEKICEDHIKYFRWKFQESCHFWLLGVHVRRIGSEGRCCEVAVSVCFYGLFVAEIRSLLKYHRLDPLKTFAPPFCCLLLSLQ
jgi:hypothetical protein